MITLQICLFGKVDSVDTPVYKFSIYRLYTLAALFFTNVEGKIGNGLKKKNYRRLTIWICMTLMM